MEKAIYVQKGESIEYKNETSQLIEQGTVIVVSDRIGIAGCDIAPKMIGSLHLTGVFKIHKKSQNEIAMGKKVYFDNEGITEESGNVVAGFAIKKAAASDTSILVKID